MTAKLTDQDVPGPSETAQKATPAWMAALCEELDPNSKRRLEALGPKPDWRCLEIGAGSGSMTRWLADRCPSGRVVATDLDLTLLSQLDGPNLEIVQHDVTAQDFPESSIDLIYSRYVFCHLRSREQDLAKVVSWLAPGGWLLLEDPAKFPFESSPNATYSKVSLATMGIYKERVGSDFDWPRSFPAPLAKLGLENIGVDGSLSVVGGGRPMGQFWGGVLGAFGADLVAMGGATDDEVKQVGELMYQDDYWDLGLATIAAWGQRPSTSAAAIVR